MYHGIHNSYKVEHAALTARIYYSSVFDREMACKRMFQRIQVLAYDVDCSSHGKRDFLRRIPCRHRHLCEDADAPGNVVPGNQFTYVISQPRPFKEYKFQCEVKPTAQKSEPQEKLSCAEEKLYQKSTAPTAFFVFLYEVRQLVNKSGFKNLTQVEIARCAGRKWRQMTSEEKQPYLLWARTNRHKRGSSTPSC
uniref:HMG box domain-containing protein n=1 Tax=Glossina pallidipes TaxID=7398 RepID=A0A1A9ZPJ9_GLOPL